VGKRALGKNHYHIADICSIVALGFGDAWQEQVLNIVSSHYDFEQTRTLISGGDGNYWARRTFQRFGLMQEFILDHYHPSRAAWRVVSTKDIAQEMVNKLCQQGFAAVCHELWQHIEQALDKEKEKLKQFYHYIDCQQYGFLDLPQRGYSNELGILAAIEENVDKLIIHRLKEQACCWKLCGARAMLSVCQNKESLKHLAFHYIPIEIPEQRQRRKGKPLDRTEYLLGKAPILEGSAQEKPGKRVVPLCVSTLNPLFYVFP
jgi:hypothetical protein